MRARAWRGGAWLGVVMVSAACTPRSEPAKKAAPASATAAASPPVDTSGRIRTGAEALGDWTTDAPGVRRRITTADLPSPNATESARNSPRGVPRPAGAMPRVPAGFVVSEFATGLAKPRVVRAGPGGEVFVVESEAGRVRVLRDVDGDGRAEQNDVYAEGLHRPFGLAFFPSGSASPTHLYVANTDSVVRFAYQAGDLKARGAPEVVVPSLPSGREQVGGGGHWTRDVVFSRDNQRMFVSVGSRSNVSDDASEERRACILAFTPEGKGEALYASGIRNPVGLAIEPTTGDLWTSVNERDELGDDLVPDYITRVKEGGFYGWPWFYLGPNQDPRHAGKRPELRDKVIVPDVLIQSHSASLALTFYTGASFPEAMRGSAFAAEHGSWNRARRTGYKVIRVPASGDRYYEDFLTGFVTPEGDVWGRPVGVAVARDGALLVSDDLGGVVWRVAFRG